MPLQIYRPEKQKVLKVIKIGAILSHFRLYQCGNIVSLP